MMKLESKLGTEGEEDSKGMRHNERAIGQMNCLVKILLETGWEKEVGENGRRMWLELGCLTWRLWRLYYYHRL